MLEKAAWWLVLIGALNWLLIGLVQFDAVAQLFGGPEELGSRIVYTLVGVAGLYLLPQAFGIKMVNKHQ